MLHSESPLHGVEPQFADLTHSVWEEIYPFFVPGEFEQPRTMDVGFLRLLTEARILADVPFRVLDTVRGDPRSAHGEEPCTAVDLQLLNSYERQRAVRGAVIAGFVRVGIYPGTSGEFRGMRKKDGGGLHLDASRTKPPRFWTMGIPKEDS